MKYRYLVLVAILVLALVAMPASAFTANKLVINVMINGDANIQFSYHLTWPEKLAYSMIPQKEQIVQSALSSKFPSTNVDNIRVSKSITDLTVRKFAIITTSGDTTTYKTPAVSFMIAQDLLNQYRWIARAITPDFSPAMTIVRFPGGQIYTYNDASGIPAITYTK